MTDISQWTSNLISRVDDKLAHIRELVDTKLLGQEKMLMQQFNALDLSTQKEFINFTLKLEDVVAEVTIFKETQAQQLTLLDQSLKHLVTKQSEEKAYIKQLKVEMNQSITKIMEDLDQIQSCIKKLEEYNLVSETVKATKEKDPLRKEIIKHGNKALTFILAGLGLFLLKNIEAIIHFIRS